MCIRIKWIYFLFLIWAICTDVFSDQQIDGQNLQLDSPNIAYLSKSDQLSICVYNSSISFVTDIRKINLKKGLNVVYIYNISPKLNIKSVGLKCSKRVLSYELLKRSSSQSSMFKSSIGNNIAFKNKFGVVVGVLKGLFFDKELNKKFAIINKENETYIIPVKDCISVFSTNISTKKDALKINIISDCDTDDVLTLSYITEDINWQPEYSICINDQMTSADIDIKGALINNTDWDMKDVDLTFDYSTPDTEKFTDYQVGSTISFVYPAKLSLKHSSSAIVPMNTIKDAKLNHNYYIKVSENPSGNMQLPVHNLLSFEMSNLNIKTNSNALLYLLNGNSKKFLGQQGTKSIEGLNETAFLVGTTGDISAHVRYVDTRNITDKISEVSIAITIKNNKDVSVNAYISTNVDGEYSILKESDNRVSPKSLLWNISIAANSKKELYYKMRVNKR